MKLEILLILTTLHVSSQARAQATMTPPALPLPAVPAQGPCLPLGQPIPFSVTNARVSDFDIQLGQIPGDSESSVGEVYVGGDRPDATPTHFRESVDVYVEMTVVPYATPGVTGAGADVSGSITLKPLTLEALLKTLGQYPSFPDSSPLPTYPPGTSMPTFPPGTPMPTFPSSSPMPQFLSPEFCVSGVAIKSFSTQDGVLYHGKVFLYLNHTDRGVTFSVRQSNDRMNKEIREEGRGAESRTGARKSSGAL